MTQVTSSFLLLAAALWCIPASSAEPPGTDKTLVSWVTLADANLRDGSILTLQRGLEFDGIVFGEKAPGKWMAGSHLFQRTEPDQNHYPAETAARDTLVQLAIVYKDDTISIYRNGEPYASYKARNIDLLSGNGNFAVFGLRHVGGSGSIGGAIEDARIYGRALTVEDLKSLEPNRASAIEPYAWWDFEGDTVRDIKGVFTENRLQGGAKIADGKLVLGASASLVAGRPYVAEVPAWPENPPANWLTFHLAHPGPGDAMPGDPNCAFFWKGRYHLHYIYRNATGFVFAHVSSVDLVHWKWHPTTLTPVFTGHGMFSGTGFITKDGKPAIIYHGEGSGRNQIAVAEDDALEKWSKPWKLEPNIRPDQDGSKIANWDPDAWLDGNTYFALSGGMPGSGKPPTLFKSADLKNWDYLGLFLDHDMPDVRADEDISCPNFFKIGDKHMLLCISHNLGCRYYIGEWKDQKFSPAYHARMSWNGNNYFAPESVVTENGRRIMWAWLLNLPIAPGGVQGLPRELELPADGVLRIRPLRELEKLRHDQKQERNIIVKSDGTQLLRAAEGDAVELRLEFKSPMAKEFGLYVLCDANREGGMRVAVNTERKLLQVGNVHAPLELKEGEDLTLRVFLDKNLVEVFVNDVQAAVGALPNWSAQNTHLKLFSMGGDSKLDSVFAWKMKSVYEGDRVFKRE